jgi:mono/diheme cytochrome c family protein
MNSARQRATVPRIGAAIAATMSRVCVAIAATVAVTMCVASGADAQRAPRAAEQPKDEYKVDTNEELQPTTLPPLPIGMTIDMIVEGDRLFHGKGGCFACHGAEAQGLPAAGDGITSALFYARPEWRSIDSLISQGMSDALTRSPIAMPARGARGDLSRMDIQRISAYVWAINAVRGEPWPGGHTGHASLVPPGSTKGTSTAKPVRIRGQVPPAPLPSPSKRPGGNR